MCEIAHRGAYMAIFKEMGKSISQKNMIWQVSIDR